LKNPSLYLLYYNKNFDLFIKNLSFLGAKMVKIVKRNMKESELDIKEIRKALEWAHAGLEGKINYLELESHVRSIYTDKITTEKIQKSLIDLALKLTSVEQPEWRILAARLVLMDLYKKASHNRGYGEILGYDDYVTFVKDAVKKGLYDPKILELYTLQELAVAQSFIKPEYDRIYDFAGMSMLINRYLVQERREAFELPQEMFLTIALLIASTEKENRLGVAKEIYEQIAGKKISLATPILINLRRPDGNLSSCFVLAMNDSLDSIFYSVNAIAQISKNGGGVGINLSRVRASGGEIRNTPNASGGVIPWIRIVNDTAVAVNQLGKRAGAVTVALDIWHMDILDFLELQTENGDQRKKAYDLFPQIVIPDLFMKRAKEGKEWTLFDPNEVRLKYKLELAELIDTQFEAFYEQAEKEGTLLLRKTVQARDILKQILKTQIETGMPYLFFKDTANRTNPNQHDGMIGSGNLCQESFSNFKPSKIHAPTLHAETIKQDIDSGLIHTCNLVSLNLSILLDRDELAKSCAYAVRILDNTIDLTKTPIQESELHNEVYRTIGVGAMGLADWLAINHLPYASNPTTLEAVNDLFEFIAYNTIKTSAELAKSRGAYPRYHGSEWNKGIIMGKDSSWFLKNSKMAADWVSLIHDLKTTGIRNSQLLAIAPNTSSALVQGCSSSVLPIFNKFFMDKNAKGAVPICPPYIQEAFWFYKENKNIPQHEVVDVISTIQKWIDQGISFELLYNLNSGLKAIDIYNTVVSAWEKGCKTLYYTRTIQKNSNIMNDKEECISCAN